ncbi:MAG: cysteate synthase [Alkalispirochaetaceae bacterium]
MASPAGTDRQQSLERLLQLPHYTLRCLDTGETISDEIEFETGNYPLTNPRSNTPAFLRAEYTRRRLEPGDPSLGLYQYAQWLPVRRVIPGSSVPITYKSTGLSRALGLKELYITFSGYRPEIGAHMISGTFKECEAYAVVGRLGQEFTSTLVIASAGNTARAFHRVCSEHNIPLLIVVPQDNLDKLWRTWEPSPAARVVAAGDGADYSDAIALAELICRLPGYVPEGGAKNVARRDGMGTTMLSAAMTIGGIPDHYVQAVGSGTGAIAAWEANQRLIADGRFGTHTAKLHLAQNAPFTLLHDSWTRRRRETVDIDEAIGKEQISAISAAVLANRKPPYSPIGGLYDALSDTRGETYAVDNSAAKAAGELFHELEGIDLEPAAAVATAALLGAVRNGNIGAADTVMLNITGGGFERLNNEEARQQIEPDMVLSREEWNLESLGKRIEN